jgi:hypothetical protein
MSHHPMRLAGLAALSLLAPVPRPTASDPGPAPEAPPVAAGPSIDGYATSALASDVVTSETSDTWIAGVFMVRPAPGRDLRELGATVLREPGRSGWGLVGAPAGEDPAAFEARLKRSGVGEIAPTGLVRGTGSESSVLPATADATGSSSGWVGASTKLKKVASPVSIQWHLRGTEVPGLSFNGAGKLKSTPTDVQPWLVAVIDTGVSRVPGLTKAEILPGWDYVHDRAGGVDDHQHGTHIASLIATQEGTLGVARGAAILPLKVLDKENRGCELDLIEAIHEAAVQGADVINMSLSFGQGYRPSTALIEAIERAHGAGAILVAAAGNDGSDAVTWPAASPRVIAVAAGNIAADTSTVIASGLGLPSYATAGPRVDLVAPGGDLRVDNDRNGLVDGIAAESIGLRDPTTSGLWMYAGSSQAAAVASGAVVRLLDAGVAPGHVLATLQEGAAEVRGVEVERVGAGALSITGALNQVDRATPMGERHVGLSAWLAPDGRGVVPKAALSLYDSAGRPVAGEAVSGRFDGDVTGVFSCVTGAEGTCLVTLSDARSDDGLALRVLVEGVRRGKQHVAPGAVYVATAETTALLSSMHASYPDAALAFWYADGVDPVLGPVADSYVFPSFGTGLTSVPMVTLISRRLLSLYGASETEGAIPLDGTGLTSVPMIRTRLLNFGTTSFVALDGTGLTSVPMILSPLRFTSLSTTSFGTGLMSVPMLTSTRLTTLRYWGSSSTDAISLLGDLSGASAVGDAVALTP